MASFQELLERAIASRGRDHPVWDHNSKMAGRALAERLGVRVPELIDGPASVEVLTPPTDRGFVLKPVTGSTARGVFCLVPADGRYRELLSGRRMSWGRVKIEAYAAKRASFDFAADRVRHPWILEALIGGDRLVDDWKAYCIGGEPVLWRQIRRSRTVAVKWWTEDFTDAGEITEHWTYDATLEPPSDPASMVVSARAIAREVAGPFVRVDLYDDGGAVFGEITPHPAGGKRSHRFAPEVDEALGERWLAAERGV